MIRSCSIFCAIALGLALTACEKRPTDPPTPKAYAGTELTKPPAPVADPSLPPASAALANQTASDAAAAPRPTNEQSPVGPKEQSTAMPIGGQNNDHSAPKPSDNASTSR